MGRSQIPFVEPALAAAVGIPERPLPPFFRASRERRVRLVVETRRAGQPRPPIRASHPQTGVLVIRIQYARQDQGRVFARFSGHNHPHKLPNAPKYSLIGVTGKVLPVSYPFDALFASYFRQGVDTLLTRPAPHPFSVQKQPT